MSMMLNSAGIFSGLSGAPAVAGHISFNAGYATTGSQRALVGDFYVNVRFRADSVDSATWILGSSSTTQTLVYTTTTTINVIINGNTYSLLGLTVSSNTWYRVILSRTSTALTISFYDEFDVLINSVVRTVVTDNAIFQYVSRRTSTNENADFTYVAIGTPSEQTQHLYVMQESDTIWNDTGTVGGWNLTLTGTYTWVP